MNFRPWGNIRADLGRARRLPWVDLIIVAGLAGAVIGGASLAREWVQPRVESLHIDLNDPLILFRYTFYSLCRGLIAYGISLTFTLVYGYWAAKDPLAERVLIPLLDILQSIPVLSFLPGVVLALVALFPRSNTGMELACVLMIFTGQAWNMTFSFYHSLKAVPQDMREAASVFRLDWWRRLRWVELPFATMGLVWNSMMSMAGGWFFLTVCEAFTLKGQDFRLPGLGSYVAVAVENRNLAAMGWAILAMVMMIVLLDQLLWRPVVVWAQKFRLEEGASGPAQTSWFLRWLRHSRIVALVSGRFRRRPPSESAADAPATTEIAPPPARRQTGGALPYVLFVALMVVLAWGGWKLLVLLSSVTASEWGRTVTITLLTLLRVFAATAIGTLWAVPAGIAIGLSPRLARFLQPIIQIAASFPAPMLFPIVMVGLNWAGISLNFGSVVLMLLGTQWYILFNVVAGAMAIPADLREAARSFNVRGPLRWWRIYVPAIFPYLVTGWVTATGGAWNASIVSEYVKGSEPATGIGAQINTATENGEYAVLAASTLVLSLVVVTINRTLWRYCHRLAETRFSASK